MSCVGCGEKEETEEELLFCEKLAAKDEQMVEKISYNWLFGDKVENMISVGKIIAKRLKVRKQILDEAG